jgi:putative protein kinase ArgK-like GTPase of G3E family
MTPEFGAASQLEIDMLDFTEFVAINKFDRGALDALRDVAKKGAAQRKPGPRRPTRCRWALATHLQHDGVTALYQALKSPQRRPEP